SKYWVFITRLLSTATPSALSCRNTKRHRLFNLGEVACCQFDACRADTPNEFCQAAFRGKHDAQKKQIASLRRFHIGAERLGGVYKNDLVGSRGFTGLGHVQS